MNQLWQSFIPRHVVIDLYNHPDNSPIGREQRFSAVILFADVSGFTNISEALGQNGRQGTEELTTILNSYFTPMIDLVQDFGGIVGKFGGDAMTVFFPYKPHTKQATIRRAIQCALDMQAKMESYQAIATSAGTFGLAMKAGLAAGPLYCTTIGNDEYRLEYIIAGSVLDVSAEAEHYANRGEVVIANHLLPFAGKLDINEARGNFTCISTLHRRAKANPLNASNEVETIGSPFIPLYIHPSIAQRLEQNQIGFVNEHRPVTILFANFSSFDYDHDPEVGEQLQQYLSQVLNIIQKYDGYLNKVDMGDKGSKYIILFGTPIGHENDEERAIRCALELQDIRGARLQIGINSGFVYCGLVGSTKRQEYTVMGDAVNMAARLMQAAASGQIITSEATWKLVKDLFVATPLNPMRFKGKSDEYNVFAIEHQKQQSSVLQQNLKYDLPMVGRKKELQQVQELLHAAQDGQGQVIGVSAQPGVGKTRFSYELIRKAAEQNFTIYTGAAQSYGTTTQYLVWRSIWQQFFGIFNLLSPLSQIQKLSQFLSKIAPYLNDRLPLLGPLLNLDIPDNPLSQSLEPQMRVELLKSLLLDCLQHQSSNNPMLLVLEDCHWMDDLSYDLLAFIGHNITDLPIVLLLLYRPPEKKTNPLRWVGSIDPVTEIILNELTATEAAELAQLKLQSLWSTSATSNPDIMQKIIAKAQGNPFYLEEMVNYLHDQQISFDDAEILNRLEIPDSLQNLIISRIDQLPEATKTTLKVASIIGRVFPASWIWGSYAQVGTPSEVEIHLNDLQRLDLTPLYQQESEENQYIFKHVTTQEVAYDSLAFSTRTMLHEQVGRFIEQRYEENLAQHIDQLAFHYGRSQTHDKQRIYFRLAGERAQKAYANQTAIDYYQKLIPLLSEDEQAEICFQLAQVQQLIGEWKIAEEQYRTVLKIAEETNQIKLAAEACLALGSLIFLSDPEASNKSREWLQKAQKQFEYIGERQGIGRVFERLSFISSQQGNYQQALAYANQQLVIAEEYNDLVGISTVLNFIGVAYFFQGKFEQAEKDLKKAINIAQEADYKRGIILASNDLAGVYMMYGDYHKAQSYLNDSQTISQEIGDIEGIEVSIANSGLIYHQIGQADEAKACILQAISLAITINDWATISNQLGNLGSILDWDTHPQLANQLTEQAIKLNRSLNLPYYLCEFLQQIARIQVTVSNLSSAKPANDEALKIAKDIQMLDIQFEAELLDIKIKFGLEEIDVETAVSHFHQLAITWTENAEQAAINYEIAKLMPESDAKEKSARLYKQLYENSPKALYRQRYQELTALELPKPEPLPPPPQLVDPDRLDLEELLKRVGVKIIDA